MTQIELQDVLQVEGKVQVETVVGDKAYLQQEAGLQAGGLTCCKGS